MKIPVRVVSVTLAALLLAVGVQACSEPITSGVRAEPSRSLDGEAVFRALVFGEGPVAARVPEIASRISARYQDATEAQREQAYAARGEFMAKIRDADPQFFDRFGAAMTSGNHLRIEQGLADARGVIERTVEQATGARLGSVAEEKGIPDDHLMSVIVTIATFVTDADARNFVVTTNVIYNSIYEQMLPSLKDPGSLGHDEYVELIATRLAA